MVVVIFYLKSRSVRNVFKQCDHYLVYFLFGYKTVQQLKTKKFHLKENDYTVKKNAQSTVRTKIPLHCLNGLVGKCRIYLILPKMLKITN
jgi:hypothetical protein